MSFLTRHKATAVLTAAFVLIAGGVFVHHSTSGNCGSCPIAAMFGVSEAYAGPGSCSGTAKTGASCTGTTEAKTETVSAKSCNKDECISKLMADKGMTRKEAEAVYAKMCASDVAEVKTASSTLPACCTAKVKEATAASATAEVDKDACIAKCMAEKGMTREEAEKCYEVNHAAMMSGGTSSCHPGVNMVETAVQTDGTPAHSRQACIDACLAKGMTQTEAEACADRCIAHDAAAHSTGAACCSGKAKSSTGTTGSSNTSNTEPGMK